MRLTINLERPWVATTPTGGEALAFLQPDLALRLHTTSLYDRFAAAPREHGEIVHESDERSSLGWPVRVVERVFTSAATPMRELELRFQLLEFGGSVVVTGADPLIAQHRYELVAAGLQARPDWSGAPVCVAELLAEAR